MVNSGTIFTSTSPARLRLIFRLVCFAVCVVLSNLSLAQVTTTNPQSGKQTMNNPFILVNSDVPGGFLSATLVKDADSYVEVTASIDKPEIGKYKCVLERALYEQCDAELLDAGFSGLASPKSLAPTVATLTLGRGAGADPSSIQLKTFPIGEVPPSLDNFLKISRKAIDQVRTKRYRVIEGRAKSAQAKFLAKDKLAFQIELTNTGIEKTIISNPISSTSNVTRVTLALSSVLEQAGTAQTLDVARNELVVEPTQKSTSTEKMTGGKLALLADESIRLKLSKSVYAKPGTYRAIITVHFVEVEPKDEAQITGMLKLTTEEFTIQAN